MDALRTRIAEFIGLPQVLEPPAVEVVDRRAKEGYTRSLLRYAAPDADPVDAFLFEPTGGTSKGNVLALHQHNSQWGIGKSEIAGLAGDPLQAFGPALARRGVTVLAPDAIGFESQFSASHADTLLAPTLTKPGSSPDGWLQYYNQMAHRLICGDLLIRKMVMDCQAAVSVLQRVNSESTPIGVLGHSMGGGVALFVGALDTRVAFVCSSGAVSSYRYKRAHGIGLEMAMIIPGFAAHFETADLIRCIAPRPVLVVSAEQDSMSGDAADVVRDARAAFDDAGAGGRLAHVRVAGGHGLDRQRFDAIVEWTTEHVETAG
jgi:dienelactone hydrolase